MSDFLEYQNYYGSVDFSAEDMRLFGKVLFIDSLLMYDGESVAELESAFRETIDSYLAHCKDVGKQPNKPYSGTFNVRVGPELHRQAVICAFKHKIKLNEFVIRAIKAAVNHNSIETVEHVHIHEVVVHAAASAEGVVAAADIDHPLWKGSFNATAH